MTVSNAVKISIRNSPIRGVKLWGVHIIMATATNFNSSSLSGRDVSYFVCPTGSRRVIGRARSIGMVLLMTEAVITCATDAAYYICDAIRGYKQGYGLALYLRAKRTLACASGDRVGSAADAAISGDPCLSATRDEKRADFRLSGFSPVTAGRYNGFIGTAVSVIFMYLTPIAI